MVCATQREKPPKAACRAVACIMHGSATSYHTAAAHSSLTGLFIALFCSDAIVCIEVHVPDAGADPTPLTQLVQ